MHKLKAPRWWNKLACTLSRPGVSALQLDFVHPRRRVALAAALLLGLGILACVAIAAQLLQLTAQMSVLEATAAQRVPPSLNRTDRSMTAGAAGSGGLPKSQALKAEQVNSALGSLSTPWDAWFVQLESVGNRQVALASLQPEADGRRVRLSGEARRFGDVLAYMTRLEATDGFANVFLIEHGEAGTGGVSFALTADWVAPQ